MEANKIRVLLADDHAVVRAGLRLIIDSQPDMRVVGEASNGLEALELLKLNPPVDCIVCDLRMPVLGGESLFEQLETLMPNMASRFVFVTGDYTDPETRAFLERSGQPVVAKPYEVAELLGAVATILRRVGAIEPA